MLYIAMRAAAAAAAAAAAEYIPPAAVIAGVRHAPKSPNSTRTLLTSSCPARFVRDPGVP